MKYCYKAVINSISSHGQPTQVFFIYYTFYQDCVGVYKLCLIDISLTSVNFAAPVGRDNFHLSQRRFSCAHVCVCTS